MGAGVKHSTTKTNVSNPPAAPVELVGFLAGGLKLQPGDKLPDEIVVVPWGRTETRRGPVICNERTVALFAAQQAAQRRDHVMGDFNHNTMPGRGGAEPRAKAAKAVARVEAGVGIIARIEYYTAQGKEYVGGGHYPDISPAVEREADGTVVGLHSFAFVEHGEMKADSLEIFSASPALPDKTQTQPHTNMDYKKLLCGLLGLPDDTTDEQLAAALAKADAGETKPVEGMSAAPLLQLKARLDAFEAEVKGLKASAEETRVDGFIAAATAEGKEIKLDRPTLVGMGAENARKYLDSLTPGVVPVSGADQGNRNAAEAGKGTATVDAFSAEEIEDMKRNGIDPEKAKANLKGES